MIDWSQLASFLELYDSILRYRRYHLYYDVLVPWVEQCRTLVAVLAPFRELAGQATSEKDKNYSLWVFYALSRVSDYLLLPFQSKSHERDRPALSRDEYISFFEALGFTAIVADTADFFSPFHHEVVEVEQSANVDESITVLDCFWPGLRFGEMLFSRCGVIVAGGNRYIRRDVAESSTLYFTHRRLRRATNDLSMGWGSNSQWRTRIRRDYETGNALHYNVDGTNSLNVQAGVEADRDGLTAEERLELCRNRCFIRTAKPHDDLWPFDDRFEEHHS
jgi:hypothetical protein